MEEIKINDYVRTIKGTIGKIIEIAVGIKDVKDTLYFTEKYEYYHYNDIAKHSKNIKDLIETGDIVIYRVNNLFTDIEIVKEYTDARTLKTELRIGLYSLEQVDIKKILTKERFENECFKVEEGQDV